MYQVWVHMIRWQLRFSPKVRIANIHREHWELAWKFILYVISTQHWLAFQEMFPFGPPIQVMRVQLWIKVMGGKMWCYWEHLKEHIGNLKNNFKMHFEHDDNALGTWWEPIGNIKIQTSIRSPNGKTNWASRCYLSPCIIWLSWICVYNYVCHPFFAYMKPSYTSEDTYLLICNVVKNISGFRV